MFLFYVDLCSLDIWSEFADWGVRVLVDIVGSNLDSGLLTLAFHTTFSTMQDLYKLQSSESGGQLALCKRK